MKKTILILLLLSYVNVFSQEIKKCVITTVEKIGPHKVKVIKKNNCVEPPVIKIQTYIRKEWEAKKRKKRKNEKSKK